MTHAPEPHRLESPADDGADVVSAAEDGRQVLTGCPLCLGRRLHYAFSIAGPAADASALRVVRCADCRFMLLNPQPSDAELAGIYGAGYFCADAEQAGALKAATARGYLDLLDQYRGRTGGRLLEVGCGR